LDLTLFARALRVTVRSGSSHGAVDPGVIQGIPEVPCPGGGGNCWQSPIEQDGDLDGVSNLDDNCPQIANPQQGDSDGDGLGTDCDGDDDNDGFSGTLETGMGSSDGDPAATPEHWTLPGTCEDGVDNDLDGLVDAADPGCEPLPPTSTGLPELLEPGALVPEGLRSDLGGVREGGSIATGILHLSLDLNLDGIPDEEVALQGAVVISEGSKMEVEGVSISIDTELVALVLTGDSPGLGGPVVAGSSSEVPSPGRVTKQPPSPPIDFPAESFFDVFFVLHDGTGRDLANAVPLHVEGVVTRWPFQGEALMMPPGAPPVGLFDGFGAHVANILQATLSMPPFEPPLRADRDGDGDVDQDDFGFLQQCYTDEGDPEGVFDPVACACFDSDRDGDVDDLDVDVFALCDYGPAVLADPMCGLKPCDSLVSPIAPQSTNAMAGHPASPGAIAYRIINQGAMPHAYNIMEVDAGGMPLDWPWLSLNKQETTINSGWSDTVIASIDALMMPPGDYEAYLGFTDDCGSLIEAVRAIHLTVTPPPECASSVSPVEVQTSSAYPGQEADPSAIMYTITNGGFLVHHYTVEAVDAGGLPTTYPYLDLSAAYKVIAPFSSDRVFAELNTAGLLPGTYTAYVKITDDCVPPGSETRAIELTVYPPPPAILAAVSLVQHGPAGLFPIDILAGDAVEGRAGGPSLLVVSFDMPIVPADGTLTIGEEVNAAIDGTIDNAVVTACAINNNQLIVELAGVPDDSCLTLVLSGIASAIEPSAVIPMTWLNLAVVAGDVDGDGQVTLDDHASVLSHAGQPVDGGNFRNDLDHNGEIHPVDDGNVVLANLEDSAVCP